MIGAEQAEDSTPTGWHVARNPSITLLNPSVTGLNSLITLASSLITAQYGIEKNRV